MNLLHLFFSVGALSAPLVVGALIEGGVGWRRVFVASGLAPLALAAGYAVVGDAERRSRPPSSRAVNAPAIAAAPDPDRARPADRAPRGSRSLTYVASEVGVSNWLVRFLEPAPLSTATLGLSLFWAGLALGRLVSSVIADRFDHVRFTIGVRGRPVARADRRDRRPVAAPLDRPVRRWSAPRSGPIFPMILAIGGERYAERSAAVSSFLTGCGVVGGTVYPPLMGVLSVTIGLTAAMFGNVLLGLGLRGLALRLWSAGQGGCNHARDRPDIFGARLTRSRLAGRP